MVRKNVVLIHWHDVGRYLGTYGNAHASTPNLDRLAEKGVRFDRAFSTAPLCSPARASLFTGRYPHSNGMMGLAHLGWEYHANERTLPMLLSTYGYRSVLVGLQHESADASTLGYDEVVDLNADRQAAPVVAELAADQLQTLAAGEQPFLLVVGMFEPHRPFPRHRFPVEAGTPVDVPAYLSDTEETRDDLRGFNSAVTYADAATGRILAAVDDLGLGDDTIVIFTTDHGIPFPRAKSTLYDAGIEVALIVRMPGGDQAGARPDRLVSLVDVLPTLLELVDIPCPHNVQGQSFADMLRPAGPPVQARDAVYAEKNWHGERQYDPVRCIRTQRYKYIVSYEDRPQVPLPSDIARSGSAVGVDADRKRPRVELFDLDKDPDELVNLAGDPLLADVESELAARLCTWQRQTHDPILDGPIQAARVDGHGGGPHRKRTRVIDSEFVQRN